MAGVSDGKLTKPSDFASSGSPSSIQLLPPSCFETATSTDPWNEFAQCVGEIVDILDECNRMKQNRLAVSIPGPSAAVNSSSLAGGAALSDNISTVLQRLTSEVQHLHSKLEQCNAPVCHSAGGLVPSVDSMIAGVPASIHRNVVDQYEIQLRKLQTEKDALQHLCDQSTASWETKFQEQEHKHRARIVELEAQLTSCEHRHRGRVAELENQLTECEHRSRANISQLENQLLESEKSSSLKLEKMQQISDEEKEKLLANLRKYSEQVELQMQEINRMKTYVSECETASTDIARKQIVDLQNLIETLNADRERLTTDNKLLSMRLTALTDILTTQEQYISQSDTKSAKKCLLTRWREKVYELLIQLKSTNITSTHELQQLNYKVKAAETSHHDVMCKVDVLTHTLRDKQATCDMQQSRIDSLLRQVVCLEKQLSEQQTVYNKTQSSFSSLAQLIERTSDVYKTSTEAAMKLICTRLQSFNNRVTFASSRMQLLKVQVERRKAAVLCEGLVGRNTATETADDATATTYEVDEMKAELMRVVCERDKLAALVTEDARNLGCKITQATQQATCEVNDLRLRLTELHDTVDNKTLECNELRHSLDRTHNDLIEAVAEIEQLKTELAKSHLSAKSVCEEMKDAMEAEHREEMLGLQNSLAEARRQHTTAVITLRQFERQTERDKERLNTELENIRTQNQQEVNRVLAEVHALKTENNLLLTTVKQHGLIGKYKPQERLKPVDSWTLKAQDNGVNVTDDVISDVRQLASQFLSDDDDDCL